MSAERGSDAFNFYSAKLGDTRELAASVAAAQTPDAGGPLPPGRYLLHIGNLSATTVKVWLRTGKFVKGDTLNISAAVPACPFSLDGLMAIEINVHKEDNDRVAAITSAGTASVYITPISQGV